MGPFGSPDTITIVLPLRASLSLLTVFSDSVNMDSVDSISLLTVVTPQESNNCFSTSACDVSATIGRGGLYFETLRAVLPVRVRSEEHTSELQSQSNLVCRLLLEKKTKH